MLESKMYKTGEIFYINEPATNHCPMCGAFMEPVVLYSIITEKKDVFLRDFYGATILYYSPQCKDVFLCKLNLIKTAKNNDSKNFAGIQPEYFPSTIFKQYFQNSISSISPKFVEIYNQSYAAEQHGLYEICGMGYRKSLEFLIKDFLISKNVDDRENIENQSLSQCIKALTDEYPKLKLVAERATWLGNDESHYVRKHLNYDLETLKSLIVATAAYIELESVTNSAATIEYKK